MEYLRTVIQAFANVQWSDILDIVIVAFLFYKLLPMLRSTGTARIAGVVGTIIVIAWMTGVLRLHVLSWILNQFLSIGLLAVVVLFQPELRRMIDHISNMRWKKLFGTTAGMAPSARCSEARSRSHFLKKSFT